MIRYCASFLLTNVAVGQDDSITPVFLLYVFVFAPALAVRANYLLKVGKIPPRKGKRFLGAILGQFIMVLPAAASANKQGLHLWPANSPSFMQWLAGVLVLCLLLVWARHAWQIKSPESVERARLLLPEGPDELKYWIAISLTAGLGEEYVYRGVAYQAVLSLTGAPYSASLICAIAFGAAHLHRGLRNGAWTSLFGLMFQLLVLWTGSLYLSIFLHTTYDLFVGVIAMQKFKEAGLSARSGGAGVVV